MNWENGYSASYYMMEVDPMSWRDVERIEITGGSISRNLEALRQSADIECVDYPPNRERWVRVYLDVIQGESGEHVPLFTGLATSPERNVKGAWEENKVQCYSVLKPADDVVLTRGYYAPAGMSSASVLRELLFPIPAPVDFYEDAPALRQSIVAEDGETNLTMIERILSAINWNARILGDGTISFGPYSSSSVAIFDSLEYDVLETEINVTSDWYSCPNVFMASANGATAIAKDEESDSPMSIKNRGREVWMYESGCSLSSNESIHDYAKRRLSEEQECITTIKYDRRFVPNIFPGDMITMHYPSQGIFGQFLVNTQSIEIGHAARTSEEVVGVL